MRFILHGTAVRNRLLAAFRLGVSSSTGLTLVRINTGDRTAFNGLEHGSTGNTIGDGSTALLGVVPSGIGIALTIVGALLAPGGTAANRSKDGGTGAAGTGILAAVGANVVSSSLGIADAAIFAPVWTARVGVVGFARAVLASGRTFRWRRAALIGSVARKLSKAGVVEGTLLRATKLWVKAMVVIGSGDVGMKDTLEMQAKVQKYSSFSLIFQEKEITCLPRGSNTDLQHRAGTGLRRLATILVNRPPVLFH